MAELGVTQICERLDKIENKIDMLNKVTIENGGGTQVTYERKDFYQMIYDRINFKGISRKIQWIAGFIFTTLMIVDIVTRLRR